MRIAKFKWLVFIEVFIFVLSRVAFAQSIFGEFDPIKFVFGPDVPQEWYQVNMFMQWLVFPFIGIWLIIFGILEQLGIFRARRSLGGFLALIVAFITSSTGGIVIVTRGLFMLMGTWGLIFFVGVFILGTYFWAHGEVNRFSAQKNALGTLKKEIEDVDRAIGQIPDQIMHARDQHQIEALKQREAQLFTRRKQLEDKREAIVH